MRNEKTSYIFRKQYISATACCRNYLRHIFMCCVDYSIDFLKIIAINLFVPFDFWYN